MVSLVIQPQIWQLKKKVTLCWLSLCYSFSKLQGGYVLVFFFTLQTTNTAHSGFEHTRIFFRSLKYCKPFTGFFSYIDQMHEWRSITILDNYSRNSRCRRRFPRPPGERSLWRRFYKRKIGVPATTQIILKTSAGPWGFRICA